MIILIHDKGSIECGAYTRIDDRPYEYVPLPVENGLVCTR
jgi:hypothetical protein